MKRYQDCTYYELLEIPQDSTFSRLEAAFQLARRTYKEKSLSTYSLFTEEERAAIWKRIEEAHAVLADFEKRKNYDIYLARGSDSSSPWEPAPPEPDDAPPIVLSDEVSGSFLKSVREKRKIPLQEVALSTRIAITYLSAIEEEKFSHLPPEVYIKGYLRDYARILKLDPQKVIDGFLRYCKSQNPRK